ncbi:geminin [Culicoides brevitarsis]|uniref:geminin n=1 Tax=Culicoides brevitarsis TaxID=469753 RepID=UPI00307B9FAC
MSAIPNKIFIQVESSKEQQEHIKNSRKTLKTIQNTAVNKENLVGRLPAYVAKESLAKPTVKSLSKDDAGSDLKHKKPVAVASSSSQTLPASSLITEEDLTSETAVSDVYWEVLAEKRRLALEETLEENEYLHDKCERLESELNESQKLLNETRELVNVLTEMLSEKENAENERTEEDRNEVEEGEDALAANLSDSETTNEDETEEGPKIIHYNGGN